MAKGPEKKFEDLLRKAMTDLGAYIVKMHGNQFTRDLADLLVGYDGRLIWIECKHLAAKQETVLNAFLLSRMSPGQMWQCKKWKKAGVHTWVACGDAKKKQGYVGRTGLTGDRNRVSIEAMAKQILFDVADSEEDNDER